MTDVRCPNCMRLAMVLSADFDGPFGGRCRACKTDFEYPADAVPATGKILCECGKWIARGTVVRGWLQALCPRDRVLVRISAERVTHLEKPTADGPRFARYDQRPRPVDSLNRLRPHRLKRPRGTRGHGRPSDAELVTLIEARWEAQRIDKLRRRAEIAVGIRFDVFARDGFRCRYCGRGPDQGVYLEADHVIPRSVGGPDTMANLVTACWDCNRGKSAKAIDASELTA